ncbi:ecotropic viral integration site 5 protein homolog isoform X1 [Actinia tenebrosa]|uniref:Ecotropic viral integration site 5 protein homolog isoform X1 n=1 Tax=Actinia tenebrosa TaxID=6105 RepID=A0A6P8IBG2_ACTTE|nr:ecotropic viral integration site 5 protein homolog isoform X1 [Actinia tenebrosa]
MATNGTLKKGVDESQKEKDRSTSVDELVEKLEEQNRLLTNDSRALTSIPDTPKRWSVQSGSGEPLTPETPENCDEICDEGDDVYLEWGQLMSNWEYAVKKKPKNVRDMVRKGIPNALRGLVWQLLCGARDSPLKDEYPKLIKTNSACERMIKRDIARTFPDHSFFKDKDGVGQGTLFNVIKAYSVYDKEVGYCQGSAFIVGILLMQMPEEEAFCVLVKLMQDYRMREIFKPTMAELGLCMYQLENLLQENLPELFAHFQAQGFHTAMYASSWFLTLFASVFPLNSAFRVMDIFISEGRDGLFRVIMAILLCSQEELLQLDMEFMLKYFQKEMPEKYEKDMDSIMKVASDFKVNSKKMKRLEREYTRVKHKEAEDNEEIRRLKTENRLLMQRIDELEQECSNLADRLIQGQVTRAQEQEEIYALRNALAVTKRHDKDTSAALTEANLRIEELTMFKSHVVSELSKRECKNQPSARDMKIITMQAEIEQHRLRDVKSNQLIDEMAKTIHDLEDQVFILKKEKKTLETTYPQVTFTGSQESEEASAK